MSAGGTRAAAAVTMIWSNGRAPPAERAVAAVDLDVGAAGRGQPFGGAGRVFGQDLDAHHLARQPGNTAAW